MIKTTVCLAGWSSVGCFSKIRCHRNQLKGTSVVLVTASSSNGSRNITSTELVLASTLVQVTNHAVCTIPVYCHTSLLHVSNDNAVHSLVNTYLL